ncbi:hypothetical protein [uncultured Xanthomonas sp.]|uniref:RipA family octameric membrane protein n=1 Tax=uncultured Xanthomonas sp. TaxID=152831 RepID=UPI0025D587D3|nr:hypothetical protein [uncultured Xanthomonas sp.]
MIGVHEKPHYFTKTDLAREQKARLELYLQCIEIRNFEISNLVTRNNFFMIFQGVLIAGVLQSSDKAPPMVLLCASLCGLLVSTFQTMMASGAKFWQDAWEHHLDLSERRLQRVMVLSDPDRRFYRLFARDPEQTKSLLKLKRKCRGERSWTNFLVQRFSVSKAPIYAGLAFMGFWTVLSASLVKGWIPNFLAAAAAEFPRS